MSSIEKLYYNMDRLVDNWTDMPETREKNKRMEEAIGKELSAKYGDVICDCMAASEKQGFIHGFQYAVSLLTGGKAAEV